MAFYNRLCSSLLCVHNPWWRGLITEWWNAALTITRDSHRLVRQSGWCICLTDCLSVFVCSQVLDNVCWAVFVRCVYCAYNMEWCVSFCQLWNSCSHVHFRKRKVLCFRSKPPSEHFSHPVIVNSNNSTYLSTIFFHFSVQRRQRSDNCWQYFCNYPLKCFEHGHYSHTLTISVPVAMIALPECPYQSIRPLWACGKMCSKALA